MLLLASCERVWDLRYNVAIYGGCRMAFAEALDFPGNSAGTYAGSQT
jgi:hypothetical protein